MEFFFIPSNLQLLYLSCNHRIKLLKSVLFIYEIIPTRNLVLVCQYHSHDLQQCDSYIDEDKKLVSRCLA